jgi:hypothetical protein
VRGVLEQQCLAGLYALFSRVCSYECWRRVQMVGDAAAIEWALGSLTLYDWFTMQRSIHGHGIFGLFHSFPWLQERW